MPEVELDDGLPRLDEIVFHGNAVGPAHGGIVVGAGVAVELHVHRHARQHLAHVFTAAQHQNGGARGTQYAALLDQEAPVAQKGGVIGGDIPAGVAGGKARAIPAHGGFIKAAAGVHVQRLGVVAGVRGIADEAQQFVAGAGVVATSTADMSLLRVAVEINRLLLTSGFWNVKRQHRAFGQLMYGTVDRQADADFVDVTHLSKEIVLNLVGISDAGDCKQAVGLFDTKHQMPTRRVGKGTNCGQRIFGHGP